MSSDPKLDQQLRQFLIEVERERAEGHTIANLQLDVGQLRSDIGELYAEQRLIKLRLDRHGKDIKAIKQHLEWEGAELDTGQHQVEDLKRHLAAKEAEISQRRDSQIWWKRQKTQWIMAAVGGGAILLCSALGSVAWWFIQKTLGGH